MSPIVDGSKLMQQERDRAVVVPSDWSIEPVDDFLLVDRTPLCSQSSGGVMLPDSVGSRYEGTVVAIGPRVEAFAGGDRVLFLPHAGIPLRHGDRTLLMFRQEAVFGKAHPPAAKPTAKARARK